MDDPKQNDVTELEVNDTIKLGEEEFSQDELSQLVGLGKIAKEVEEKYNTKIDKVYPAFTKSTQENKELSEAKTTLEQQLEDMKQSLPPDDDQVSIAKKQLREFGVVMNDDLDKYVSDKANKIVEEKEAARDLMVKMSSLQDEIKRDGKPEVTDIELLEYMRDNPGLNDPSKAYKYFREEELDAWKETQISKGKRPGLNTITTSQAGSKQPMDVRPNSDNLAKLTREALGSYD